MTTRRLTSALSLVGLAAILSACGGSGSGSGATVSLPKIAPARVFTLGHFTPADTVSAGRPTTMSFTVQLPDGRALTRYKTGPGPHTGVHLIIVRDDLAYIIHEHPPIPADGVLHQTVRFPAPGPYRVLVDVYPDIPGGEPNFQLFRSLRVQGPYHPIRLPAFKADQVIDGYHFRMLGRPDLHAIQAAFVRVDVTAPDGRPVHFTPWFGALAHAIFFKQGSLDYFHTHVCAPDAPNCGSLPGVAASRISGRATAPGKITLGVLLPLSGTWRLFLQLREHGRVLTAPFTLRVS